ncbi:glycosyltransferase 87 family protein [Kitasatospora atroaurantiaca]|uniref:Alpha-1,2-mannosyltransferase n=1 Tax=Kitasatospora atroaurantiaca TaxID=285545 RepID=A0A561EU90_9ACTN|nr:glycosyltransferase 87 family protein [Kitasatospora atroaurantiaca]TWE19157.1 alpha-1,2-mannosyltransferase [Kitasatospora atroaurantiaca]
MADLAPGGRLRTILRAPTATAGVAAALLLALFAIVRHFHGFSMVDMLVYQAEGEAVTGGQDLYAMRLPGWDLPATYPPFAAILFVPTTWFAVPTLRLLVTLVNVALLALLAHFSFRLVGWPRRGHRAAAVLLATGLGVFLEPVYTTFQYGQVNLVIACLVMWDLTRSDANRLKGVGIGLAMGIKITPGAFAVYLLLTGRVRAALLSGATFLATVVLGGLALPGDSYGFWTTYLWDSRRVGITELVDNQSLRGALARLFSTNHPGLLASAAGAAVAVAGLTVAVLAARSGRFLRRPEAWGVVCTAITAVLVSPISWTHHWVWCVPLLVLLCAEAAQEAARSVPGRRRPWRTTLALVAAVFLSHALWSVPKRSGLGIEPYWQPVASVYALTGLAVLGLAAVRLRRAYRRSRQLQPVLADAALITAGLPADRPLTKQI